MTPASASGPRAGIRSSEPDAGPVGGQARGATLVGIAFDRLTETEVIEHIVDAMRLGRGGWVVTPNIDICRLAGRDPRLQELVSSASLVIPDGMPLLCIRDRDGTRSEMPHTDARCAPFDNQSLRRSFATLRDGRHTSERQECRTQRGKGPKQS